MTTTRRAYAGGAKAGRLIAPTGTTDLLIACDALVGWPDGSDGMFAAVIGKGSANEEKVLVETRTGANLTINKRGYDDTIPSSHSATDPIEHCHTATDDDEANEHSSNVYGHGVPVADRIVGEKKAATLENKTIDGGKNVLQNIPSTAIPEIDLRLDEAEADIDTLQSGLASEVTARTTGDTARYTKTEADNAFLTKTSAASTYMTPTQANTAFLDQTEGDARYPQVVDSGWSTDATGFAIKTGWTLNSVRWRSVKHTVGGVPSTLVDLYISVTRGTTALTIGPKGDVSQNPVVTIPTALRPAGNANLNGPVITGRLNACVLDNSGLVSLSAVGGTVDVVSEALTMRGVYYL